MGRKLRGGEVIELVSDLGGGKTTFVKGLAQGLGTHDLVRSPSFTLSNKYAAHKLSLYHFDFHRLNEPGIMRDELAEILVEPTNIVAVEWAEPVESILPTKRLVIRLKTTGDSSRIISFEYPETLNYLIPANI